MNVAHVAQPKEPAAPPICAPRVPEKVIGPVTEREVVATPYADPAPTDEYTSTLLFDTGLVVERPVPPPVDEIVIGELPMTVKGVQVVFPEQLALVVATPYTPAPPFDTRRLDDDG